MLFASRIFSILCVISGFLFVSGAFSLKDDKHYFVMGIMFIITLFFWYGAVQYWNPAI
jgi:hypothetical protein